MLRERKLEKAGFREANRSNFRLLLLLAAGLLTYAILLTALTGDIGFDGDDWWYSVGPTGISSPDRC